QAHGRKIGSMAMLAPGRYIADLARFAVRKGAQERHDTDALSELEARPVQLPPGLELEWLGGSGYRMAYEGNTLLIDPYVSRVPLRALIRRTPAMPVMAMIDRYIGDPEHVVGVLVGHTH